MQYKNLEDYWIIKQTIVHMCWSHFHTSEQRCNNYNNNLRREHTSSRLIGCGSCLCVIELFLIISIIASTEPIFSFSTLPIIHINHSYGSSDPSVLHSLIRFFHASNPWLTNGPFSPSGNHGVGVVTGSLWM